MTVIAIDGPAGSGKSTVARLLGDRLGCLYLDTGAMYRAAALLALREGVSLDDGPTLAALTRAGHIGFSPQGHVMAHDEDVAEDIRRPAVSAAVSEVSAHAEVRDLLVAEQRHIAAGRDVVIEGRDIGTVVFADAAVKVFLSAAAEVRAERRRKELVATGEHLSAADTLTAIQARDTYDSSRAVSPLRKAADAVEVDTSAMTVDEVVDRIETLIRERVELPA
jgi:cytidylate kinase